jgi:hypothetical protein
MNRKSCNYRYEDYELSVADILNQCAEPSHLPNIMAYFVAMCIDKIYRRMNHPIYSKPFHNALVQAKVSSFAFPQHIEKGRQSSNDRQFLDMLPKIVTTTRIAVPNLVKAASLKGSNTAAVYTRETYKDFHKVLRALLSRFCASLKNLAQIQISEVDQKLSKFVYRVAFFGSALQSIANGSIIETHLQAIAPLLAIADNHAKIARQQVGEKEREEEEEEEDDDVDLATIQPHTTVYNKDWGPQPLPLWKSYRNWLRLVVSDFDAVIHLTNYISRIRPTPLALSIKIDAVPDQGKKMLRWTELLANHFPYSTSAGVETPVKNIIQTIEALQKGPDLDDTANYFREHFGRNANLSRGNFSGTLHCEACIASLICISDGTPANHKQYKSIQDRLSVSDIVYLCSALHLMLFLM